MKHLSAARLLACIPLTVLVLAACSVPVVPQSAVPDSATGGPTSATAAADNGLVVAAHAKCNVGVKILQYLATGDNQGDPQLDILFSRDVGTSLPQARSIASQYIQQCDTKLFQQETQQASAGASASAEASRVAAEAQSSAQAAQNKAARLVLEQEACAALGGTVREGASYSDLCVSSQGKSSDGTSCGFASIPFQSDGTLLSKDISDFKGGYPGCFL